MSATFHWRVNYVGSVQCKNPLGTLGLLDFTHGTSRS
jgi:hypothetical protein